MAGEFVTRRTEITWDEGVAGGMDSNELWKSLSEGCKNIKGELKPAPFDDPDAKGLRHPLSIQRFKGSPPAYNAA
jgi:hypothetical protein